ncbi:hypothetical protein MW887_009740 [Aspergillus wentii]|nr:hypothetical protein MW887_009740 [Aspergillus wentii]
MAVCPPFNFLTLHYAYFLATPLICSAIFWGAAEPSRSIAYVDALFMCVSAMTGAGLNTVDLSSLNSFQQSILFALLMLGHAILISIVVLFVRKRAFQLKFNGISYKRALELSSGNIPLNEHASESSYQKKSLADVETGDLRGGLASSKGDKLTVMTNVAPAETVSNLDVDPVRWVEDDDQITIGGTKARQHHHHRVFPMTGVGARHDLNNHPQDVPPNLPLAKDTELSGLKGMLRGTQKYFASKGLISRNSQFHGLTPAERERLGGVEYRACIPASYHGNVDSGRKYTLPMLPAVHHLDPETPYTKPTIMGNMENHSRLCVGPPQKRTIIILNGIDWAGFEILAIGNQEIENLPRGYRVLDGLFQGLAVRSGGFYVVTISDLRQGLLVLYVLMMYVSAFPVLVTIRNTNVYEERSLGIYAHDDPLEEPNGKSPPNIFVSLIRQHLLGRHDVSTTESSRSYFVHQQLRSQLSHDIWWVALGVLFISIAESDHFKNEPVSYSTFNIIFEVVSAYGCVGVSVGYPGKNYSFCGTWHPISKLILAAVTLRGRHRGLPVAIDQAVMLPDESLAWAEEEDADLRREKARSLGMDRMPMGTA